jgi:phage-related protein
MWIKKSRRQSPQIIYLARMVDAVHVLHCFQKKSRKTSQRDIDLGRRRYRDLKKELAI